MKVLIDTNVLARHSQPDHELHPAAVRAIQQLYSNGNLLCIVPHVLYEYWAVATRPVGERGLGLTVDEARLQVDGFRRFFLLLRDERRIYELWQQLVQTHRVHGKPSHDARLAAAMQRHGLTHLLTFNASDFSRYAEIEAIKPQSVMTG